MSLKHVALGLFYGAITASSSLALTIDEVTKWSEIGPSNVDLVKVMGDLGITDLELLDPLDPLFIDFAEEIRRQFDQAPTLDKWDEQEVTLVGFITPLEFNGESFSQFLLVPYEGACIHVPAPPRNQTVLVNIDPPVPVDFYYDAIAITGKIYVDETETELAKSGYRLEGYSFEVAPLEMTFETI